MGAALHSFAPRPWPRLLSATDAADYLSISPTTLKGLGIGSRKIGKRVLYDVRDLDRYVDRLANLPAEMTPDAAQDEERRFFERRRVSGRN